MYEVESAPSHKKLALQNVRVLHEYFMRFATQIYLNPTSGKQGGALSGDLLNFTLCSPRRRKFVSTRR